MGAIWGRLAVFVLVNTVFIVSGLGLWVFHEQTGMLHADRFVISAIVQTVVGAVFFMVFFQTSFWRGALEYIVISISIGVIGGLLAIVFFRAFG